MILWRVEIEARFLAATASAIGFVRVGRWQPTTSPARNHVSRYTEVTGLAVIARAMRFDRDVAGT